MKKLVLLNIFIFLVIINCSSNQSGTYFPTDDNKTARDNFIEKIEYSAPTKLIVTYKENTTELNKAKIEYEKSLKKQQNDKGNPEIEELSKKMVEATKQLMELAKAHETIYDCRKEGDVITVTARNQLGMEGIVGVFDVKDGILIGRKGYEFAGTFKKLK